MADASEEVEGLLPAARAGSSEALGQAFETFRGYLLSIANQRLDPAIRAKSGASDIVQETFLEAHRDIAQFTGTTGSELKAWLLRLLLNNLANSARRYKATGKRTVDREVGLPDDAATGIRTGVVAARPPTPSVAMMADERAAAVERALARLPEDSRRVIVLRNREDRPFAEIAELMGRSENAVRKLWFRAIELLQKEMDQPP